MAVTTIQSMALSGQLQEPPFNLCRHGPENAAQYMLLSPATVRYSTVTSGAIYADTIPALTPARVYGKGPSINTVDTAAARYVLFIEPQYNGPAILWIAPEGYYNYICQQGFVIPLYYASLHLWQTYQGTGGVALPPPGGGAQGSGAFGAFLSQSAQGSGVMSTANINFRYGSVYAQSASQFGMFFRFPAAPVGDTTLVDWNLSTAGYFRIKLGANLAVTMEYNANGTVVSSVVVLANTLQPNTWYWLESHGTIENGPTYRLASVTGPGATLMGSSKTGDNGFGAVVSAIFGLGHDVSGAGYRDFPNAPGWAWSKFVYNQLGPGSSTNFGGAPVPAWAPLTVDPAAGTYDLQYLCRDGLGAEASLVDSGKLGLNLPASSVGLTVVAAGPYA
jgi:hypothetical protein